MKTRVVYNFAEHCFASPEFQCGGIPEGEKFYLRQLGWTEGCEELCEFYEAVMALKRMNDADQDRRDERGRLK